MFRVCSVNVNGIRAAERRGGMSSLAESGHDVVLLQEVRASNEQLRAAIGELGDVHVAHAEAAAPGRSGVAIVSRTGLTEITDRLAPEEFADSGRWVEATADLPGGPVRLVSVYVHTGEAETPKQDEKHRFLDAMTARMAELVAGGQERVLIAGDLNIAHTERDIRNAKGNAGKAGFLPSEQEYLTGWLSAGWVDLGRAHAGDVDGPYTWWTWRGQAFDRDVGWRIDYALASPALASTLTSVSVGRAPSYAQRWSDHAPVTVEFSDPPRRRSPRGRR